ncbi:hypothetical protein SAMN05421679_10395 [Epilithonimonas pallida]|uniref:Uncharacterized protein n=1 Tax=Epilithonimonas pallida TaxID=373671 RepID=A0ABY1R3T8_9FLAO|nr:hypothetical protein SAMN05421679_10395 [Epilithonimonas pallida]
MEEFINSEFNSRGYTVIYKKLNYNSNPKKVDLAFLNKKLSKEEMEMYNRLLDERGIHNTMLNFRQDDADLKSEILSELNKQDASLSEKDVTINNLRQELNKYKVNEPGLVRELNVLFPELKDVSLGKIEKFSGTDSAKVEWLVLYHLEQGTKEIDKSKMKKWLNERLDVDNTLILQDTQSE